MEDEDGVCKTRMTTETRKAKSEAKRFSPLRCLQFGVSSKKKSQDHLRLVTFE